MTKILIAGAGGFIGAALRYTIVMFATRAAFFQGLLAATLVVNLIGCFVIGLVGGIAELRDVLSVETRAFLLAGVLGGFTTYSAFGFEAYTLFRDGERASALWYVGLHLVLGFAMVWLGMLAARAFAPAT